MRDIDTHHLDTALRVRFRRRRLRDQSSARGRRLVLVDIENVVGGPCYLRPHKVGIPPAAGRSRARSDRPDRGRRHVAGLESFGWDWPRVRYVVGRGRNGADRALLEVLVEDVADRYTHVVLATGGGLLAEMTAALTRAGVRVTVVAHEVALSSRLRLAAADVVLLSRSADSTARAPDCLRGTFDG